MYAIPDIVVKQFFNLSHVKHRNTVYIHDFHILTNLQIG